MLVEQVCQQVLLLVCEAIEEGEQVRFVAHDHLRRDDDRSGRLANYERRFVIQTLGRMVSTLRWEGCP